MIAATKTEGTIIPQKPSSRHLLIDMLRGYALFGVFMVHMTGYFSGWNAGETSTRISDVDQVVSALLSIFFTHKFRALFCFLFGLGFYFQLRKYEEKGGAFQTNFLKRLLVLMIFGLAHAYFIWTGDILHWYAMAGLVLLFTYRLNTKTVFILAVFLSVIVPNLYEVLRSVLGFSPVDPASQMSTLLQQNTSYPEVVEDNIAYTNHNSFFAWSAISTILTISGYFLLGIWAGRVQLLTEPERYRPYFRPVGWLGLGMGLLGGLCSVLIPIVIRVGVLPPNGVTFLLSLAAAQVNTIGIFLFYLCLLVIMFQKSWFRRKLTLLVPIGRMTLTNYIVQSVMGVSVFFGFGLGYWGKCSLPMVVVLTVLFFGVQVWYSHWWLQRFKQGPLEWLWRTLMNTTLGLKDGSTLLIKPQQKRQAL